MKIALIRHGDALPASQNVSDEQRPLSELGVDQIRSTAKQLAKHMRPRMLLSSTLVRAQQSADHLHAVFLEQGIALERAQWQELAPSTHIDPLKTPLLELTDDVIVVTHQPLVGVLGSWLSHGEAQPIPWQTAECRCYDGDIIQGNGLIESACFYPHLIP